MRKSMFRRALPVLAFAAALPLASAANAALYLFTLTGPNSASFSLDSSPVPSSTTSSSFSLQNINGTYNGTSTLFSQITFSNSLFEGGFMASSSGSTLINLIGPQLYTGTLSNPTFTLGNFSLSDSEFGPPNYSLSIAAAVPEPASWAMMLAGFGLIGLAIRRRKVASPAAA